MGAPVEKTMQADPQDDLSGPVLLVKLKKKIQARYPLERFRTIIGRSSECDIVLDRSSRVSRNHAQVLVVDGEVVVEDLGSRNGMYVNRKPCKRYTLRPGDCIGIGQYRLHFLNHQPQPAEQSKSVREIASLFRLWRDIAVTSTEVGSHLFHLPEKTGEVEILVAIGGDEHPSVDEGGPGADDEDHGDASDGIQAVDAPQLGLSTFVRPVDEQDQMMEKAKRLVGQSAAAEAGTHKSVPENPGIQTTGPSLGGRLRRRLNRRRKLTRRC